MVDNTIALRLQSPQVESPLNRMARGMQMLAFKAQADTAQQTTAKNAMLNQAFQASIDPKTGAIDYGKAAATLASLGGGAYAPDVMNAGSAATTARIAADKAVFDQKRANLEAVGRDIMAFGNANDAKAYIAKAVQDGHLEPQMAQAIAAQIPQDPTQFPVWQQRTTRALTLTGPQQLEQDVHNRDMGNKGDIFATPKYMGGTPGGVVPGSEYAIAPKPGSGGDGAGSGKPDAWGKRVDPANPSKTILVPMKMKDGEYQEVPAAGGIIPVPQSEVNVIGPQTAGLTPAQAQQGEMPAIKERAKLDTAYPTTKATLNDTANEIDNQVALIDDIINDPSLETVTGSLNQATPTWRSASVALEKKFETLKNKAWVQRLINMRNAGGRIGGASDMEGRRIEDGLGAFSLKMKPDQLVPALEKFKSDLLYSKQNLLDAFDATYAYKTGGAPNSGVVDFNSLPE